VDESGFTLGIKITRVEIKDIRPPLDFRSDGPAR
jgi:regulator of protease activity HflC (stomatin/prohibitin superfamily)